MSSLDFMMHQTFKEWMDFIALVYFYQWAALSFWSSLKKMKKTNR